MRTVSLYRDDKNKRNRWKLVDFTEGEAVIYVESIVADEAEALRQAARLIPDVKLRERPKGSGIYQAVVK